MLLLRAPIYVAEFSVHVIEGTFSRILFSQTDNCAPRTISFLLFHSLFIVHRSVLTAGNLIKVKAQQSFKKFHL